MKKKKSGILIKAVISLEVIVLLTIGFLIVYTNHLLDKINYADAKTQENALGIDEEQLKKIEAPDEIAPEITTAAAEIELMEQQLLLNWEDQSVDVPYDHNGINILLVGIDSRNPTGWSSSDTMIILSANRKTHKVIMTSLMRDIYLRIPGHGYNRINAACAYGGPELLLKTIEGNFKFKIDHYIAVDFYSFIEIVDLLGGIEMNVSEAERENMNLTIAEVNDYSGFELEDGKLLQSGERLLTGKQALAYARVRHVGNNDFGRTERQRELLNKLIEKTKKVNIIELNKMLNVILPSIKTNLARGQIISLLLDSLEYKKYEIIQKRIPADHTYSNTNIKGRAVLKLNMKKNIKALYDGIYE